MKSRGWGGHKRKVEDIQGSQEERRERDKVARRVEGRRRWDERRIAPKGLT